MGPHALPWGGRAASCSAARNGPGWYLLSTSLSVLLQPRQRPGQLNVAMLGLKKTNFGKNRTFPCYPAPRFPKGTSGKGFGKEGAFETNPHVCINHSTWCFTVSWRSPSPAEGWN